MTTATGTPSITRRPAVSKKLYLCVASDGWAMPLPRDACDQALSSFLSRVPMPTKIAVEAFQNTIEFRERREDWSTVLQHIARMTHDDPNAIPMEVGIALWGQALAK